MDKKAIIFSFILGLILGAVTIAPFTSTKKMPEQVSEEITLEYFRVKNLRIDKINGKSFESLCNNSFNSNWINPDSEPVQDVKVEKLDATKLKVEKITTEDLERFRKRTSE